VSDIIQPERPATQSPVSRWALMTIVSETFAGPIHLLAGIERAE
jgi:hypothetical protein